MYMLAIITAILIVHAYILYIYLYTCNSNGMS